LLPFTRSGTVAPSSVQPAPSSASKLPDDTNRALRLRVGRSGTGAEAHAADAQNIVLAAIQRSDLISNLSIGVDRSILPDADPPAGLEVSRPLLVARPR